MINRSSNFKSGSIGIDGTSSETIGTNATFEYNAARYVTNITRTGTENYRDRLAREWGERYRLVSVDDASSFIEYKYDVQGRKTTRIEGNDVEHYVYDGNQIVADVDASGNLLRTYVWGLGIDNLLFFTDHASLVTYYPIKDHQNTVLALVDENGDIVETYDYDAYGRTKVFSATGTELTASAYGNRYTFQGREIDWATGLYYFRARWYNPETGRWLSKDPIGISGGMNLYEFVSSNPANFIDPSGLCEEKIIAPVWPIGKSRPPKDWPKPGRKWKWEKSEGRYKKGGRYRGWHDDDTHNGHWDESGKNGENHENIYPDNDKFFKPSPLDNMSPSDKTIATVIAIIVIAEPTPIGETIVVIAGGGVVIAY